MKWFLASLLVILVVVRLYGITNRSLSFDESNTWRMSSYEPGDIVERLKKGNHPLLHYVVWKVWLEAFGDSLLAFRGLSVVLSVLGAMVLLGLVRTANLSQDQGKKEPVAATQQDQWYLVLPLVFPAFHVLSVQAGSTARMYSLGFLFAGLSSWFLILALREENWRSWWWLAYALAVAAFCYTHNFAFFTILGQTVFVVGDCGLRVTRLWLQKKKTTDNTDSTDGKEKAKAVYHSGYLTYFLGFVLAGWLALALYLPWVPIVLTQAQDVREGWWVPPLTSLDFEQAFFHWLTGFKYQGPFESRLWMGVVEIFVLWTLWQGGRWAWFFFLQALMPWLGILLVWVITSRSLLLERYLVFGQVGLFGLWAVGWRLLPNWPSRAVVFLGLGMPCLLGLADYLSQVASEPSAVTHCAHWLKDQSREGDLFLLDDYRAVNSFRYYTRQAGLPWFNVKAPFSPGRKGVVVHIASMTGEDIYWPGEESELLRKAKRVWRIYYSEYRIHQIFGQEQVFQKSFKGGDKATITLVLQKPGP